MFHHDSDLLMWGTNAIIWQWDLSSDIICFDVSEPSAFGYPLENYQISYAFFVELIHPDDKYLIEKEAKLFQISRNNVFQCEYRIRHQKGDWIWVKERARKTTGKSQIEFIEGVIQIIDSEKKMQLNLLEEEFKFKALFENSPVATWLEDLTGIETFLNELKEKRITDLKQYFSGNPEIILDLIGSIKVLDVNESAVIQNKASSKTELIESIKKAFNTDALNDFINELDQMLKGENVIEYISNSLRQDKSPLIVLVRIFIPLKNGERDFSKVIVTGTDITQSKLAENELRKAKEKAEENDKLKSAFLSNISHEIRTPINGIIGLAEIIKMNENLSIESVENLEEINRQTYKLLEIVEDIIEISKLESGNAFPIRMDLRIFDLFQLLTGKFSVIAKSKGLEFESSINDTLKNKVLKSDYEIILKVLSRLLSNAIKFTHKGFVKFEIQANNSEIYFKISDSGIGIELHHQEIIFEPFRQLDYSHSRNYEGTGLGLSICQKFAKVIDGRIEISSIHGYGSEFTLFIPQ